ncbi:hypothetical protein EYF80_003203 [Liparis tanakae]|uniref:Uncharacterized protein n=1 Tax=Liparis tanakae TaxID=230148 RepID=A0A4Z2J9R2_9TELE|nr:hypothetical protein EYF80_003203 [Liparis tanakae]
MRSTPAEAWETTVKTSCPEDLVLSSRPEPVPVTTQVSEDLPGSIQELRDERPCSIIHNTQFDKYDDHTAETTKQIAEDMEAMKRRHLEMVHELEENYQATAQEKQTLPAQNIQLLEEQRAKRRRSKEEALQWHREKVALESGRPHNI